MRGKSLQARARRPPVSAALAAAPRPLPCSSAGSVCRTAPFKCPGTPSAQAPAAHHPRHPPLLPLLESPRCSPPTPPPSCYPAACLRMSLTSLTSWCRAIPPRWELHAALCTGSCWRCGSCGQLAPQVASRSAGGIPWPSPSDQPKPPTTAALFSTPHCRTPARLWPHN